MKKTPILHVTSVRCSGPFLLDLSFNDGTRKRVHVRPLLDLGPLRRLLDPAEFAKVRLDRDWGTVRWDDDLDLAPEALWALPDEAKSP